MVKSLLLRLVTLLVLDFVYCQLSNITIDDSDTSITYLPAGAWHLQAHTTLDYPFNTSSTHSLSQDTSAVAIFTFTGVAVYFWSPLWPYLVNSLVTLDGRTVKCYDLQDHTRTSSINGSETVASVPMLVADGLPNTPHTLTVSMCPGGPFIVVDAITYTVHDTLKPSTTISSSSLVVSLTSTASTVTPTSSSSSNTRITAIAVGSAIGGAAVLGGLLALFVLCLRRTRPNSNNDSYRTNFYDGASDARMSSSPAMSSSPQPGGVDYATMHQTRNGFLHPNSQYIQNAHYDRWSPASPASYYPNTLTTISEGSPPSDASRYPQLPEL